jgi:hypothetical protein
MKHVAVDASSASWLPSFEIQRAIRQSPRAAIGRHAANSVSSRPPLRYGFGSRLSRARDTDDISTSLFIVHKSSKRTTPSFEDKHHYSQAITALTPKRRNGHQTPAISSFLSPNACSLDLALLIPKDTYPFHLCSRK